MVIRCRHCPTQTHTNEQGARATGWRIFNGLSVTGKAIDDVVCPRCAGTATDVDLSVRELPVGVE